MINFTVSLKPGAPIYEQLIFAVKRAVVTGQLQPGDKFPSVRELSKELKVNPNTIQKAVTYLVREKILVVHPGIGSLIAELSSGTDEQLHELLHDEVERLIVEARRLSISKQDLLQAIEQNWELGAGGGVIG